MKNSNNSRSLRRTIYQAVLVSTIPLIQGLLPEDAETAFPAFGVVHDREGRIAIRAELPYVTGRGSFRAYMAWEVSPTPALVTAMCEIDPGQPDSQKRILKLMLDDSAFVVYKEPTPQPPQKKAMGTQGLVLVGTIA